MLTATGKIQVNLTAAAKFYLLFKAHERLKLNILLKYKTSNLTNKVKENLLLKHLIAVKLIFLKFSHTFLL